MSKYIFDNDLQFKIVRLTLKQKILRVFLFLVLFVVIGQSYSFVYTQIYGSKKEEFLYNKLQDEKFKYILISKDLDNYSKFLEDLQISDEKVYRAILNMKNSSSIVNTEIETDYKNLEKFESSKLIIPARKKLDRLETKATTLVKSYSLIQEKYTEWNDKMEHLPLISPVKTILHRGDGIKFREVHPILGRPAWHHGQDFPVPMNTNIYATGSGIVKRATYDKGLGNYVVIDHSYGYESYYGHLSSFKVKPGDNVKRGDIIGLSGTTGYSTGPHLHYQINLYGSYQNPLYFFNDDLTEDEYIDMINVLTR